MLPIKKYTFVALGYELGFSQGSISGVIASLNDLNREVVPSAFLVVYLIGMNG